MWHPRRTAAPAEHAPRLVSVLRPLRDNFKGKPMRRTLAWRALPLVLVAACGDNTAPPAPPKLADADRTLTIPGLVLGV
jgi:hypothetical protein